jgi:putative FmdB family regulatory protein
VPLYEYQCARCGRFEVIRKFSDSPLLTCPTCGSEIQKLASAPAIQFKGTGWYITDYARKSTGNDSGQGGESKGRESKGGESKGGEGGSTSSGAKDGGASSKEGGSPSKDTGAKSAASADSGSSTKGSTGGGSSTK